MRALLTSHGSTGDIYPVIALGKALVDAGHEVRFATVPFFKDEVERAGLAFIPVPPDWDQTRLSEAMRNLSRTRNPVQLLQKIYKQSIPFIGQLMERLESAMDDCDIVVSSYLFAHFRVLAQKKKKPFAVITFSHNVVPSPNYPPFPIAKLWLMPRFAQKLWNRLLWRASDRFILLVLNRTMGRHLKNTGNPKIKYFLMNPGDLSLVAVSEKLLKPAGTTHGAFQFTGYLRWQSEEDASLEKQLREFRGTEKLPILTFGSVSFDKTEHLMQRFLHKWPSGKKLIIQSGWAGLSLLEESPEIFVLGKVSHDQLFRHGSVIIHHGGAGTTASALHAGVPQIIIPHFGDQFLWAREVRRLGSGIRIRRRKWPERIGPAVSFIENSIQMQETARELAAILSTEDGPGNAVRELESLHTASIS
jgi:UDP:flavonoid glycosyltransferase YjiC (YdhE family)